MGARHPAPAPGVGRIPRGPRLTGYVGLADRPASGAGADYEPAPLAAPRSHAGDSLRIVDHVSSRNAAGRRPVVLSRHSVEQLPDAGRNGAGGGAPSGQSHPRPFRLIRWYRLMPAAPVGRSAHRLEALQSRRACPIPAWPKRGRAAQWRYEVVSTANPDRVGTSTLLPYRAGVANRLTAPTLA
jgi:hypothetical protein